MGLVEASIFIVEERVVFLFDLLNKREVDLLDAIDIMIQKKDERHRYLYDMLTVLDSKSSSLMIFNSVMAIVTAEPFFVTIKHDKVILILVLLATISSLFSFFVVRVSWPFLGKADHESELKNLARTLDRRTRLYQVSWLISFFAVIALIIFSVIGLFK